MKRHSLPIQLLCQIWGIVDTRIMKVKCKAALKDNLRVKCEFKTMDQSRISTATSKICDFWVAEGQDELIRRRFVLCTSV